jgi:LysM repeat protein
MQKLLSMIRNCIPALAIATLSFAAAPVSAQDGAALQEIRDLRALVEKQSKQIDALTEQIARLNHALALRAAGGNVPVATAVAPATAAEFSSDAPKAEPPAGKRHVVIKGETLTSIAKQYNMTVAELQKANKGIDERKLQIGQTLNIPLQATPESATEKKENP